MREEGRAEAKVEGSIVEREAVLGRARRPQRIVELVPDVGDLEPKSRMAWGEVPLTPAHSFRDDGEALVATPLAQMGSECDAIRPTPLPTSRTVSSGVSPPSVMK